MLFRKINHILFQFFHFNKQERNGVFILGSIIIVLIVIRLSMPYIDVKHQPVILTNATPIVNVDTKQYTIKKYKSIEVENTEPTYFTFDPNTINATDAEKLGFSKKLTSTLINYRNKGGKFKKPEDLIKLYGLKPELYQRLENYILIPAETKHKSKDSNEIQKKFTFEKRTLVKELVEINSADSLSLVYLKGIGPGFTKRIMKYRGMLGGFHSIEQLKEVYGMTDSLYQILTSQIKLNSDVITKIPINVIDFNTLRKHPYFNFQTAQAIINYRFKHGKLTENDFKNLGIFSQEKLQAILPYLSY
ncbi:MAG: helix-hairpin-helix domain-containing protein [Bacteroidia bacterium]|nr:helix-hairpin-helix domain-containing protein [Bacteroidia bacterium]